VAHDEEDLKSIQEVAGLLGVTFRTLRFYEDRGLIEPRRVGTARLYAKRDIARMQLILRGKRLGFSLSDIQEFLDLYDADPRRSEQMRALADRCQTRIANLEAQLDALQQTLAELKVMRDQAIERVRAAELARLERSGMSGPSS
jgi:DNA-binding transcriptional MerR regulator